MVPSTPSTEGEGEGANNPASTSTGSQHPRHAASPYHGGASLGGAVVGGGVGGAPGELPSFQPGFHPAGAMQFPYSSYNLAAYAFQAQAQAQANAQAQAQASAQAQAQAHAHSQAQGAGSTPLPWPYPRPASLAGLPPVPSDPWQFASGNHNWCPPSLYAQWASGMPPLMQGGVAGLSLQSPWLPGQPTGQFPGQLSGQQAYGGMMNGPRGVAPGAPQWGEEVSPEFGFKKPPKMVLVAHQKNQRPRLVARVAQEVPDAMEGSARKQSRHV